MKRTSCAFVFMMTAAMLAHSGSAVADAIFSKTVTPSSGAAPLTVVYKYVFDNTQGNQALSSVDTPSDNKCSPVTFSGGDSNQNHVLDIGEVWTWTCTAVANATTTNTAQTSAQFTTCTPATCTVTYLDFITVRATVSIVPPSPPSVSISGTLSVCINDTVTLTAVVAGGTAPFTFKWSTGEGSQAITPSTSVAGTYPISVTVTDQSGLTASANATLTVALVCSTNITPVLKRPELPLLTTIEWGCGWSLAGKCLTQTIVKICIGGNCINNPMSPRPPLCSGIYCGEFILGAGALLGLIAGVLLMGLGRRRGGPDRP